MSLTYMYMYVRFYFRISTTENPGKNYNLKIVCRNYISAIIWLSETVAPSPLLITDTVTWYGHPNTYMLSIF